MDSKELYRHLLGLSEPWTVERVELDPARMHVEVYAAHRADAAAAAQPPGATYP